MRGEGLALCEAGTVPGIAPLDGSEGCEGQGQVWVDLGAAARLRGQFPAPEPGLPQVPGQSPLGWAPPEGDWPERSFLQSTGATDGLGGFLGYCYSR